MGDTCEEREGGKNGEEESKLFHLASVYTETSEKKTPHRGHLLEGCFILQPIYKCRTL